MMKLETWNIGLYGAREHVRYILKFGWAIFLVLLHCKEVKSGFSCFSLGEYNIMGHYLCFRMGKVKCFEPK